MMLVTLLAAALLALGLFGVLTRRDIVGTLASIEVMMGAAVLQVVASGAASDHVAESHALALVVLVLAAAEAAIGLALLLAIAKRTGRSRVDELTEVEG